MVAQVLQQAATVQASADVSYEMLDYVVSLREGIMDAWGGIILALKAGNKSVYPLYDCRTDTNLQQPNFYHHTLNPSSSF